MKIGAFQSLTTIDYPGHLACSVFTQGCNLRCLYCYNKQLLDEGAPSKLTVEHTLEMIDERTRLVDAVVVTGGEPTIHSDLPSFLKAIKDRGLKVKLNTNGTVHSMLRLVIDKGLVDFVAMDLKAPFDRYVEFSVHDDPKDSVTVSFEYLVELTSIPVEFHTVYDPRLVSKEELADITQLIGGRKKHIIKPRRVLDNA